MTSQNLKLEYYFDPFCGWCYASAPALVAIAKAYPHALTMWPSGLFANTGGRPVSSIADYAWRKDQQVAALTGQRVTTEYRDRVLHNPHGIFDSIYATRAIVALGEIDPSLEPKVLHALQVARYVDAKDTANAPVVAAVAAQVSAEHGYPIDEDVFADELTNDKALSTRTDERMRKTFARMRELSGSGVPRLLATVGDYREVIDGADLYGGAEAVLKAIRAVEHHASPIH